MIVTIDAAIDELVAGLAAVTGVPVEHVTSHEPDGSTSISVWIDRLQPGPIERTSGQIRRLGRLDLGVSIRSRPGELGGLLRGAVVAIDRSAVHELVSDGDPVRRDLDARSNTAAPSALTLHVAARVAVDRAIDDAPAVLEPLLIDPQHHTPTPTA